MKKVFFASAVLLLLMNSISVRAQEDPMKAWQDFMTPGPMHKWLATHVGTWESEVQMWMDPAAPPTKSMSTDVVTMSMNGLFQIGNYTSTMMGMPFQGRSTLGYDNAKKKFVLTWIDTFSSGMVIMSGDYNPDTKTLSLAGVQTDPMTGKDSPIRQVNVFHNENSYTSTMYGAGLDGKEMKFMEGTYKRK